MEQAQLCLAKVINKVNSDLNNNISEENYFIPFPRDLDFDMLFTTSCERKAHKYSQF